MTDSNDITSNAPVHTANPPRVLPDGSSGTVSSGPYTIRRSNDAGGEGKYPLWDGPIIDANFPPE
jgi:hypothetical protein